MKDIHLRQTRDMIVALLEDEELVMEKMRVTFTLVTYPPEVESFSLAEAEMDQQISFGKIMTLLDIVSDSVIVPYQAGDDLSPIIGGLRNNIMLLPDTSPVTICAALHAKFNSIISDWACVHTVEIELDGDNTVYSYTLADNEEYYELPTVQEWLGKYSAWDLAWWFRNDPVTWDREASSADKLEESREDLALMMDEYAAIFDEVEKGIRKIFSSKNKKPAKKEKQHPASECEVIQVNFAQPETTKE